MSATMIEADRESDGRTLAQLLGFLQAPIDLTPPPLVPTLPFGLGFRPNPPLILRNSLQRPTPLMADMHAKTFAEIADDVSARDARHGSGPKPDGADILVEPAPEEQRFVARMVASVVDATEAEEAGPPDRFGRYGFFTPEEGTEADEEHVRVSELSAAFNANLFSFDADDLASDAARRRDDEDGPRPGKTIYL